jgi:single-stranded-DNA-specific exonuclease
MQTSARMQKRGCRTYEALGDARGARGGRVRGSSQDKLWLIQPADTRRDQLGRDLRVSPLVAQVLLNRGVDGAEEGLSFLRPKLSDLIGFERMPGIGEAVERIKKAIDGKEKITIYGDYDVDGIASVAILSEILLLLGANVDFYIPHRVDEGYGLNNEAVETIAAGKTELLITVDCGITAHGSAALAKERGMDLIITDHHRPGETLPQARAIVHPALDEDYPNQFSSGSMVAFKLGWAIADAFKTGPKIGDEIRDFLINATSLAAMGTVADVMDLRGENRALTSFGLKSLSDCKLAGMQALINVAELANKTLDSFDIGFKLAPMLNAAGRLGHARLAVELLTCQNAVRAAQIADYLKEQNGQRQRVERKIFKQACKMITHQGLNHPDNRTIVLADERWHTGVVGIVASRIVDRYYRPAIMINVSNGIAQGSARSVDGFDILKAITACGEHLLSFGGHRGAAGVTMEPSKVQAFVEAFERYAKENLSHENAQAKLCIDAEAKLGEFNYEVVRDLQLLGPFGQGNPEPVFATKGVQLCTPPRRVGTNGDHLQLAVTDNTNCIRCIAFRMGKLEKKLLEQPYFNIAYRPQFDTYNGGNNIQLIVSDIQFE